MIKLGGWRRCLVYVGMFVFKVQHVYLKHKVTDIPIRHTQLIGVVFNQFIQGGER